jgi:hypothetical protein
MPVSKANKRFLFNKRTIIEMKKRGMTKNYESHNFALRIPIFL